MKTIGSSKCQNKVAAVAACLALGWLCWSGGNVGRAQTAPANLSPGLIEVVKLAQAHMSDDIITSYIKNSGAAYSLSADDIIYLTSQGVSQGVISVLQQSRSAAPPMSAAPVLPATPPPAAPPVAPPVTMPAQPPPAMMPPPVATEPYVAPVAPPGSDINLVYFQTQLGPYGQWVDAPPYGPAWRPNDAIQIAGWRPYFNQGYWEYTDAGWYWHSDVPYGDIVFHYGRWMRDFRYGWVWIPGYDWSPAWVSWRHSEGFAGWAPLPPAARFEVGVGLMFRGGLAVDMDFGLAPDDYVFVGYDHFMDHGYLPFLVPRERAAVLFRGSLVMNDYRILDGRLVVEGLGRDRVATFSHRPVVVDRIVIRDARIDRGRELERTRTVERVKEIQARPASDPLRRSMESRDAIRKPADVRGPADARGPAAEVRGSRGPAPSAAPDRSSPGARTPEPATRGAAAGRDTKDAKDTKDSKDTPGAGGGR